VSLLGLPTFPGGIHLPDRKAATAGLPVARGPMPGRLAVLLAQTPGEPSRPVVAAGERVLRGQLIAEPAGALGAALHAPTSGRVEAIGRCPHPALVEAEAIFIAPDGADQWAPGANLPLGEGVLAALKPGEIVERIRAAGLVGMGGAAFPTHVKLSPPAEGLIQVVILNGCESEPCLTADHRLMLERAPEIVRGLRLLMRSVGAARGIVAVEANKPDAFERLLREVRGVEGLECRMVAVKYPQGAERPLVRAVLGRAGTAGALVQNVATAAAVADAVCLGRPLTERIVTVGGEGVDRPANLLCRIGTSVGELLAAQGVLPGAWRLVCGGPMAGLAQRTADVPVLKGTRAVLLLADRPAAAPGACINCGRCTDACPERLLPGRLSQLGEAGRFAAMAAGRAADCIECGACTWLCPADRPILEWIRQGKRAGANR
jgi:electron transport complex protein RnfC